MKYWNVFYQVSVLGLLGTITFLVMTQTQTILNLTQLIMFIITKGASG